MDEERRILAALSHPRAARRLGALRRLAKEMERGELARPPRSGLVNNHIHTIYSFSPYSPSAAVWSSLRAGLDTAGLMDHDTVSGAGEFLEAGRILGLAVTVGLECRADFGDTPLAGRRINNPDQLSNAYIALHGIPHPRLQDVQAWFAPLREARDRRNRRMVWRLNGHLARFGIGLDYDAEVLPLSMSREGGSVTERHILYALAGRLEERGGRGEALLGFLEGEMGLRPGGRVRSYLADPANEHYRYDLLGALKSDLVSIFYIEAAREECPRVQDALALAREAGAIAAYAYLGDVVESVTGDKKSQQFEDGYLDLLFDTISGLGFQAVTYMPSRNTPAQLARVRELCGRYGLFQISGEDINSPRQPFICPELRRPELRNLIDATWALIGHEREAGRDPEGGMFSPRARRETPDLEERIQVYRKIGEGRA